MVYGDDFEARDCAWGPREDATSLRGAGFEAAFSMKSTKSSLGGICVRFSRRVAEGGEGVLLSSHMR